MVEVERDPILVVAGSWSNSPTGEWNFTLEKESYGRCIVLGKDDSLEAYKSKVVKEFGVCYGKQKCRLTYLAPARMSSMDANKMPPICISSEESLETFKVIRSKYEGVNLYVEIDEVVVQGGSIEIGSSLTNAVRCNPKVTPSKLSQTDVSGTFQQLLLSQSGGSSAGLNSCYIGDAVGNADERNSFDAEYIDDDTLAATLDAVEQTVIPSAETVVEETPVVDLDGEEEELGSILPSDSEKSESRSYDTDTSESECGSEHISPSEVEGDFDDHEVTQWTQLINNAYDNHDEFGNVTNVGPENGLTELHGERLTQNGGSGSDSSYISLTLQNIYADIRDNVAMFAKDAVPMFDDGIKGGRELGDIDIIAEDDGIYRGRLFKTKKDFQVTMAVYAIKRLFHYRTPRSSTQRIVLQCVDPHCEWRVFAKVVPHSGYFEVRKVSLTHTCDVTSRNNYSMHATSRVIAELMKKKFGNGSTGPRPRDLPQLLLEELHVTVSYWKAWRARELAIEAVHGSAEGSYRLLPQYLYLMRTANPGTVYHLETTDEEYGLKRFKYLFFAFGASIEGLPWLRKVIVVDGTQLWGKYKGCMMTASLQDGNFQIFPLAFAVVDGENDASWEWFMRKLSEIVPDSNEMVIVSDRHSSIYTAIRCVYPLAYHGACTVHLERNVGAKFKQEGLSGIVANAARAFRVGHFTGHFEEIRKRSAKCAKWLEDIGFEHWTRAHGVGNRYNLMSSNIAESLNAVLAKAKDYPITSMVEFIRSMLMRWFCLRQNASAKCTSIVTPEVSKLLVGMVEAASNCTVVQASQWSVLVTSLTNRQYHVDVNSKQCTCKVFEKLKIPCCHAIAAAKYLKLNEHTLVHQYYRLETWKRAYEGSVIPVPNSADADEYVPDELKNMKIIPPATRRPPGRPHTKRKKSRFETQGGALKKKRTVKCGRCGQAGHNRTTCKNPIG